MIIFTMVPPAGSHERGLPLAHEVERQGARIAIIAITAITAIIAIIAIHIYIYTHIDSYKH